MKVISFLTILISLIFCAVIILLNNVISEFILGETGYTAVIILLISSIPFIILYNIIESYIKGSQKINLYIKLNFYTLLISVIIIYPLLYYGNIIGAAIYFLIISAVPILFFIKNEWELVKLILKERFTIDFKPIKFIIQLGFVSLYSSVLLNISVLLIRKFIINNFNIQSAGIYQSLYGLSTNYFLVIFSFISYYTLPKISKLKSDFEICDELNIQFRFLILMVIPMILLVLTFRIYLLKIFYSSEFLEAADLFYFQLFGDFFKSLGALFGIWLIPRFKIKILFFIDTIFSLVFIFLPYLLIMLFPNKLFIIPLTYFIAYFIHFFMIFSYTKLKLLFKFNSKNVFTFAIALLTLIIISILNYYYQNIILFLFLPILILSTYLILDKSEILKIKHFILNYIKS